MKTTEEIALYVSNNYDHGEDVRKAISLLVMPTLEKPEDPPKDKVGKVSGTDKAIWQEEIKEYVKRKSTLSKNLKRLYPLLWGQCSDSLKAELESMPQFKIVSENADSLELLKMIKSLADNFQSEKNPFYSLHMAKRNFYMLSQDRDTPAMYYKKFNSAVHIIEEMGGSIVEDPLLPSLSISNLTEASATETEKIEATRKVGTNTWQ